MHPAPRLRRVLCTLALSTAAILGVPSVASAACAGADTAPSLVSLETVRASTFCLLNERRAEAGLPALSTNPTLQTVADQYAATLVRESFFAHDGLDGSTVLSRIKATGYITGALEWIVGENLAWGSGSLATPRAIMQSWMDSPGHRDNILRAGFSEVGVGVVPGTPRRDLLNGGTYVTEFGTAKRASTGTPPTTTTTPAKRKRKVNCKRKYKTRKARARCKRRQARGLRY